MGRGRAERPVRLPAIAAPAPAPARSTTSRRDRRAMFAWALEGVDPYPPTQPSVACDLEPRRHDPARRRPHARGHGRALLGRRSGACGQRGETPHVTCHGGRRCARRSQSSGYRDFGRAVPLPRAPSPRPSPERKEWRAERHQERCRGISRQGGVTHGRAVAVRTPRRRLRH